MARVGLAVVLMALLSIAAGCDEKTSSVEQTGIELRFANCLTFAALVWIDGGYLGTYTSEQPNVIEVSEGGHTIFVRANIVVDATEQSFCWTESVSVSGGSLTEVSLDCNDAESCTTP